MRRVLSLLIAVFVLASLFALAPGAGAATPTGWTKIADKGIDNPNVIFMFPNVEFKGKLYFWIPTAGEDAAPVWAFDGTDFTHAAPDGFGVTANGALNGGIVYQDHLYMSTGNYSGGPGQVWRTADGTAWERVGESILPEDGNHPTANLLGVQDGRLLIGFENYDPSLTGVQVWAFDGTDPGLPSAFTRANIDGFGLNTEDPRTVCITTSPGAQFNGRIQVCATVLDLTDGGESWNTSFVPLEYRGGTTWVQTADPDFGDGDNESVDVMATAGGSAYAGTQNMKGGQLWKRDVAGWKRVPTIGIDPAEATGVFPAALGDELEVSTSITSTDGMPVGPARVYRQNPDGSFYLWIDQFDDPANMVMLVSAFNGQYVAGVGNMTGFQVWSMPATHDITVTQGEHGSITPGGVVTVNDGDDQAFTITPDADYQVADVRVDGSSVGPVTSYTFTDVSEDHTISAEFAYDSSTWYLAEGTNAWGFSTYITIENPNDSAVTARLTYMEPKAQSGSGVVGNRKVILPPLSQTTVSSKSDIGDVDFSTRVECLQGKPIAVDRTMFWTGEGATSEEGHSSIGTTKPSKTWYLPEGSSDHGFETWTLLQNPYDTDASIKLTYMVEGGSPQVFERTVRAHSRATYSMASDIGSADASIKVTSSVPVIAERSMYRNNRREGSCSIGASTPAKDYYLAEGACGYDVGYITYVLVQNPQSSPADVSITYMTRTGEVAGPSFQMPANSRKTIRVNDQLPPNTDVSTHVRGSEPMIAERAMYWDNGTGEACHDSIGMSAPHKTFYLPDGETSNGRETWTLVQNPNSSAVEVEITYMTPTGEGNKTLTDKIPSNSRKTYYMADAIPSGRAAIMVKSKKSGKNIMVERAMYWNSRGAGTDTIGGYSD